MRKVITDALCIRAEEYGENNKILTLLTADSGKISASIHGIKSPKSKLRAGASVLAFGEYELLTATGERYSITGVNIKEGFYACWENIEKYSAAEMILELANKASSLDGDTAQELVLTLRALSEINYGMHSPYIVTIWYFLNIISYFGRDYNDESELPGKVMGAFTAISAAEPEELETFDLSSAELVELLRYISLLASDIFGSELRSLHEIFKIILR